MNHYDLVVLLIFIYRYYIQSGTKVKYIERELTHVNFTGRSPSKWSLHI